MQWTKWIKRHPKLSLEVIVEKNNLTTYNQIRDFFMVKGVKPPSEPECVNVLKTITNKKQDTFDVKKKTVDVSESKVKDKIIKKPPIKKKRKNSKSQKKNEKK